jgi:hypothetical protein
MKIIYLSIDNLRNAPFVKELVYHFKQAGKCMIVHAHFGSVEDTRFVTKRVSALMSEEMVLNNGFSGDQREIFQEVNGKIVVRKELLEQTLQTVDLLVMNAMGLRKGVTAALDPFAIVQQLREDFSPAQVYLFPKNTRSHLVEQPHYLTTHHVCEQLRTVYDEEEVVLRNAEQLLPVNLVSPANFLQA